MLASVEGGRNWGKQMDEFSHGEGSQLSANERQIAALPHDISWLAEHGVSIALLSKAKAHAIEHQSSAAQSLVDMGVFTQEQFLTLLAAYLSVPYIGDENSLTAFKPISLDLIKADASQLRMVMAQNTQGNHLALVSPQLNSVGQIIDLFKRQSALQNTSVFVPPSLLLNWLEGFRTKSPEYLAEFELSQKTPHFSALNIKPYWFSGAIVCVIAALLLWPYLFAEQFSEGLHLLASTAFGLCIAFRIACLIGAWKHLEPEVQKISDEHLPVYSVLVALYDEANQIDELLFSLRQLSWPRAKLEIKLICEANDNSTISALQTALNKQAFPNEELIIVPTSNLRTKPRALNYALKSCRGEFLVLYDAEDRPHAQQLRAAYSKFHESGETLACVQAPLEIRNSNRGFLPAMFALEYAALFKSFLPGLAKLGFAFPLGGTSNHIRRKVLNETTGAWDPHNVTEDADLGVRLSRFGYKLDVISSPTSEEAPIGFKIWLKQRTRWHKGWMQTSIVHLSQPISLTAQLGFKNSLGFTIIFAASILSSLLHPWFYWALFSAILDVINGRALSVLQLVDLFDILLSIVIYICFVRMGTKHNAKPNPWWWPFALPLYWLLSTIAAWRAFWQLHKQPFLWEKTPHGL